MEKWKDLMSKIKSPIDRFEKYLAKRGLVTPQDTQKFRDEARTAVRDALKVSIGAQKPSIDNLFTDVYDFLPENLKEQRRELKEHLKLYGSHYNLEQFENGDKFASSS